MKSLLNLFNKGIGTVIASVVILSITPSLSYAGLLGTTAQGTLNIGVSPTNYFDLSSIPGTAPIPALVINPGVEYPGNQPALQADFPGLTTHISADIGDHEILLTWINSGLVSANIPSQLFTFGLFPNGGQSISSALFDLGLPPGSVIVGPHSIQINQDAFILGAGQSAFAHYTITTVPEPATYALLGAMSLIALIAAKRKKETVTSQVS